MMKDSAFERIVARLVKELLNENKCNAMFQDVFEKARRANDQDRMRLIEVELTAYRRRIEFVKSLLGELNK